MNCIVVASSACTLYPGLYLFNLSISSHGGISLYHYWDNKYFPPQITADVAAQDGWWYKQEYIIVSDDIVRRKHKELHHSLISRIILIIG